MNPLSYWQAHGTKILGFIGGSISAIAAIDGIIPPAHLKYYMATIALTTFWRGFTNSNQEIKQ
jgi:hypothetical protein